MPSSSQIELQFPPYRIPAGIDLLYREDKIVALERRAVQVLRYLVANHDRVISKDELLEAVWPDTFITDGVLKRAVSQARKALGDGADVSRFIETYHGRGYRFIAEVITKMPAETPAPPAPRDEPVTPVSAETGLLPTPMAADIKAIIAEATQPAPRVPRVPMVSGVPEYNQLVGREIELAQLQGDYRRALEGVGQPMLIVGDPGVGKTQLAREFANQARAQGAVCLYTQFFDYQASRLAPYEIFLDLIRAILGITTANREECDLRVMTQNNFGVELPEELFTDGRLNSQVRMTTNTGALRLDDASPFATRPLGATPTGKLASSVTSRAVAPISQCFIRASHHRPLVLILDDVQWADAASREVIGHLMRSLQREPLMIVCLVRAESLNERGADFSNWLKQLAAYRSYTTLTLTPLGEPECYAAIKAIFGPTVQVPVQDLRTLHRTTGGNPYFLIEMLRLLVSERAVSFAHDPEPRWQWNGVKNLSLPMTITMAAQAKLDRLPDEVREMAEFAAIIGEEFRVETLARMTERSEDEIERLLAEGVRRGVLSERGVTGDNDARFYHNTLRRVLYDAMPARRRKRMHVAAAQAIEFVYRAEPDRVAEAISAHYEAAENFERAFDWSIRAWQAASSRLSWNEAMTCIERAQRAAEAMSQSSGQNLAPAEQLKLMFALGETNFAVGRLAESERFYGEAILLARSFGDRSGLATALLQQGQTRTSLSLYNEAIAVTNKALEIYRLMDDHEGAALAMLQLGGIEVKLGNCDRAVELAQTALQNAALNSQVAAIAFGLLGWARALQGHFTEGAPLLERAVDYLSNVGDVQRRVLLLRRSHWAELSRGRYETAIEMAGRARDDAQRLGDANSEAKMDMGIGQARIAQGLHEEGIALLKRAQEKLRIVGATHGEAETYWLLGRAHCEIGKLEDSRKLLTKAYEMILDIGDRDDEFRVMTDLARLSMAEDDAASALQFAESAMAIAEELNNRDWLGVILTEQAAALLALGQLDAALTAITRALLLLEETESGERWRAYWAKAKIMEAQNSPEALAALSETVALLDNIRQQTAQDESRFATITRARRAPAMEFQAMLARLGQTEKARQLAENWRL
ncbi:MAG: AAA family ATPase [Blastocatellia bacterium]